jgi:MFS family permease
VSETAVAAPATARSHVSILEVIRRNADVRRIWAAQVVSETGDWLTRIAVTSYVANDGGGSALEVAAIQALMIVPYFFMGPIAGVLADRLPRRGVMMWVDGLAAAVVLLYMWVFRAPPSGAALVLLCGVIVLHLGLASLFEASRSALIAAVARPEELASANALTQTTWSICLALGSGLGGLLVQGFGRDAAVLADSGSFLAGVAILSTVRGGRVAAASGGGGGQGGFLEAIRYLRSHPTTGAMLLPKLVLGFVGMNDLAFALLGPREFGVSSADSFSKYFLAVGLGTFLGPPIGNAFVRGDPKKMRLAIGIAFLCEAAIFSGAILAPTLGLKALCAGLATAGGSIVWTFSVSLLQRACPDRITGRAVAIDIGNLTATVAISLLAGGLLMDRFGLAPSQLFLVTTATYGTGGIVWLSVVRAFRGRAWDGDAGRPH